MYFLSGVFNLFSVAVFVVVGVFNLFRLDVLLSEHLIYLVSMIYVETFNLFNLDAFCRGLISFLLLLLLLLFLFRSEYLIYSVLIFFF